MRRFEQLLGPVVAGFFIVTGVACAPPDAAFRVAVTIEKDGTTSVRADCVKLAVLREGTELQSLVVKRPAAEALTIGVLKKPEWPREVQLQVSGMLGDCDAPDTLKLNARGDLTPATFVDTKVTPVALSLRPPGRDLDADNDGFVSADFEGPDCDDTKMSVYPGARQICTQPDDNDCDGALGCDDTDCAGVTFCADQADRLTVAPPATTMQRGDCLGPIVLQLENANGPRAAVRDTRVTFTHSVADLTVHTTSACSAAVDGVTIPFTASSVPVWLLAGEAAYGRNTLTATAARVAMPGSAEIEVRPRPVATLQFTNAPFTLAAGQCSPMPLTLQFYDAQNRPTDVDRDTTVSLRSTPSDFGGANIFFLDAACTQPGDNIMLRGGQGSLSRYVLARRAGATTLEAEPSEGTGQTQVLTINPGAPEKLVFANSPLAISAVSPCSTGTLQLELRDRFENRSAFPAALALSLRSMGDSPISFFAKSDQACSTPLTTFGLLANESVLELRVASSVASGTTTTLFASAVTPPSPVAEAQQAISVGAGVPTRYTWDSVPQTLVAGRCSGRLQLRLTDASMNASASATPLDFTLAYSAGTPAAVSDPGFVFYADAACGTSLGTTLRVGANATSADLYFRAEKVRTNFDITAVRGGFTANNTSSGHRILPEVPFKLAFAAPSQAQTIQAGNCSAMPYTVNVLDRFDNPTAFDMPQMVSLNSTPAGAQLVQSPVCDTPISATLPAGVNSVGFTVGSTSVPSPNPYQLRASIGGISTPTTPSPTLTVTPAAPLLVVSPGTTLSLTGGICQQLTVRREDRFGNPAPTTGPVTLTFPTGAFDVFSGTMCTGGSTVSLNNASSVSFSVLPRAAGVQTIGLNAQGAMATITATVTPGAPSLVFEAPSNGMATINAGGCATFTVARKDSVNNDVPLAAAQVATFMPSDSSVRVYSMAGCSNDVTAMGLTVPAGAARYTFYVRGTNSAPGGGSANFTVQTQLQGDTALARLTVQPGTAQFGFVTPVGGSTTAQAGQCVQVTVERRDAQGNLVPVSAGVTSMALTAIGGLSVFDSSNCMGTAVGSSIPVAAQASSKSFSVRATNVSTPPSLTMTLDSLTLTLSLSLTPAAFSVLALEGVPMSQAAGACSGAVRVRRKDSFNNDITTAAPINVTLTSSLFSFSATGTTCANATSGTTTLTITSGSAVTSDVFLTATMTGPTSVLASTVSPAVSVTQASTVTAGTPTSLVFLTPGGSAVAGACITPVRFELRDTFGNQVAQSYSVTLASSLGANFYPRADCAGAQGTTATLSSGAPVGTVSFLPTGAGMHTFSLTGTGPSLTASQGWSVSPGAATQVAWKTAPPSMPARFSCVSAGQVELRDGNGNPTAATADVTVSLNSSVASLQLFSDASCATPAGTTTISNGATTSPGLYLFATGDAAQVTLASAGLSVPAPVTVTPTGPMGALSLTTASPPLTLEPGACAQVTLTRQVGSVDLSTGTTLASVTAASGVELHTNATCTQPVASLPVTLAPGVATQTFWVKGKSAAASAGVIATVNVTAASAGSTSGTLPVLVPPLVRRGTCAFADGVSTITCTPQVTTGALERTFLVFSANGRPATNGGNQVDPSNQNVECHLKDAPLVVECSRVGSTGAVTVNYQLVSFGRPAATGGVTVQHLRESVTTTGGTGTISLTTPVDAARSFLLVSTSAPGASNDADAFPVVRFPAETGTHGSLNVVTAGAVTRVVSVQVVTLPASGAVEHEHGLPPAGAAQFDFTTASAPNSFPLAMVQVGNGTNADAMCKRRFSVRLPSNTTVRLRRGAASPPADCTGDQPTLVAVQRVQLPGATITSSDQTMNNAMPLTWAVTQPGHRSFVLSGMQGPGGQSGGESNYLPTSPLEADDLGPFSATLGFNGTQVTLTRSYGGSTIPTSVFTVHVVTIDP